MFDGVFLDTLYNDSAWEPNGYAGGLAGVRRDRRILPKRSGTYS
jgi:hypothetical protein